MKSFIIYLLLVLSLTFNSCQTTKQIFKPTYDQVDVIEKTKEGNYIIVIKSGPYEDMELICGCKDYDFEVGKSYYILRNFVKHIYKGNQIITN